MTTNKVVAVQHTRESLDLGGPRFSKVKLLDGREVFVESGLVVRGQGLEQIVGKAEYSDVVGDLVVQALVEGASMVSICNDLGIKYSVVDRWRKESSEFNERCRDAIKARAHYHAEEILAIAEEEGDPKARTEARKWLAEKFDSETFGNKTKISGDKNAPVQFIIQTGVPDRGSPSEEEKDVTPGGPTLQEGQAPEALENLEEVKHES